MEPAHKRESKEGRDCVGFAHRTVPCTQVPVQNTKQQTRAEVYRLSRKENPKKAGNHVDGPGFRLLVDHQECPLVRWCELRNLKGLRSRVEETEAAFLDSKKSFPLSFVTVS